MSQYNQQRQYGQQNKQSGGAGNRPAAQAGGQKKVFEKDPNELGIGYEKAMANGGNYITFTITQDVKAGTKVAVFANDKVKNRTEKTPTHRMKLSVRKQA